MRTDSGFSCDLIVFSPEPGYLSVSGMLRRWLQVPSDGDRITAGAQHHRGHFDSTRKGPCRYSFLTA
jgi:hypothetical protein